MFYTIYKITNLKNSKYYIGKHQTKNLDDGYMGSGSDLRKDQILFGIENFTKEILFFLESESDMNSKEREIVTPEFCLREDTYNKCPGGQGGFGYINSNPDKFLTDKRLNSLMTIEERLSRYKHKLATDSSFKEKQRKHSIEALEKARMLYPEGAFKNKKHSYETIQKMKISRKGKNIGNKNSQFGTCWVTNGLENKKIKKEDIDIWFKQGYNKGRIINMSFKKQEC